MVLQVYNRFCTYKEVVVVVQCIFVGQAEKAWLIIDITNRGKYRKYRELRNRIIQNISNVLYIPLLLILPIHVASYVPIRDGDFKKHINILLKRKWQSQWDEAANNKLHEIHPQLGLWPGGSQSIRREESVLARIRIGHTHLTHRFLLKGEDPPQCIACDCQLTVKHILFDCVDFIESRNRHFNVDTFKELFEKVPPDSILSYLHEIGLFYRL